MGRFIDFSEQVIGGGTASFPDQTNNSGKVLVTNGTEVFWGIANSTTIDDLTDAQNDSTNSNLFIGTAGFSGTFYNNNNTAIGINALATKNTDNSQPHFGDSNTANGSNALRSNTIGFYNTANGSNALRFNTIGDNNTANGVDALFANTTGFYNTANGASALRSNTAGNSNTANGVSALVSNTTGYHNAANGVDALRSNTTGYHNAANGSNALRSNTIGNSNTANGVGAGRYIADGATGLTITNYSIFVGTNTKALNDNSNNEIVIGYNAIGHGNNTATIGNTANTATYFSGKLNIANIPTSSVGLSPGDVYSNAGILTIVS